MDRKRLGRRIKAFRKLKGYTQIDLAEKLDIPISTIGAVERGTKQASEELIQEIAAVLAIEESEIVLKEDNSYGES
ncbi:helix-turn-helix domain-containing protein [Virgibacillus sp. SK37]|uniref:helix-turn-helix domain-containing protein n=1 Tax=Virgibacillus sp. SK37 TaxID=403957 RepID=UPI0004D107E2|nr:helix-turn-helix transcriptional regulator [Virgibacillus sp. SK37]AIF42017.1 transcriptional regulator [Virgibacillus sp. SK37]